MRSSPFHLTMSATELLLFVSFTLALAASTSGQQDDQEEGSRQNSPPHCSLPIPYPARVLGPNPQAPGGSNISCVSEVDRRETLESVVNNTHDILREAVIPILRGEGICSNDIPCGGPGWRLYADINMSEPCSSCPAGLREIADPRSCVEVLPGAGCESAVFAGDGSEYDQVCGYIFGFQFNAPNAFLPYNVNPSLTLDDLYMDGVSLTHGVPGERAHIWTWAAASCDSCSGVGVCPCTNGNPGAIQIPPFVGSDYFCDTAVPSLPAATWYPEDPLWEGQGCGSGTCCEFNNPPVFMKQLSEPTTDPLEVRLCKDQQGHYEDLAIVALRLLVK